MIISTTSPKIKLIPMEAMPQDSIGIIVESSSKESVGDTLIRDHRGGFVQIGNVAPSFLSLTKSDAEDFEHKVRLLSVGESITITREADPDD